MTDNPLSPGDQATVIGVGAAVLLAVASGIWRASTLRGDVNARWKKRVDFAVARIDELIVTELRLLRDQIDTFLPDPRDFDPALVVADPASLSRRAGHVVKLYRIRQHMEIDLARSRSVGPVLILALSVLALGTASVTAFYGELINEGVMRTGGLAFAAIGVVLLVCVTAVHAYLQNRLSVGEIEAGTDVKDESSQG